MVSGSSLVDDTGSGSGSTDKLRALAVAAAASGQPLERMVSGASALVDTAEAGHQAPSGCGAAIAAAAAVGVGGKLPSSRYKGVVPQPNGRWGAQIYDRNQRVWLGTFAAEADAARAYDVAAQRFRGRDAFTNYRPLADTDPDVGAELRFLASRSKDEVVDMLRKHTYFEELAQNKRAIADSAASASKPPSAAATTAVAREHLFDKTLTPSDVGKLNRLLIPKQHAEKNFPLHLPSAGGDSKCMLLNLEDAAGKVWRFGYYYWNSSQSYVLTKGWSRFVKENGLQAGDVVGFYRTVSVAGAESKLFIDCNCKLRTNSVVVTASTTSGPVVSSSPGPPWTVTTKAVRLFGVDLLTAPATAAAPAESMAAGCKKGRDLASPPHAAAFKKQLVDLALV